MKKQGNNRQSHRGNSQKRDNSNVSSNSQNYNNENKNSSRNTGRGKKPHEPHLWASSAASSTTLTSHLSMVNKRNHDGTGKNTSGINGTGISNSKSRVRPGHKKKVSAPETTPKSAPTKGTLITNLIQPTKNNYPIEPKSRLMLRRKETKPSTIEFFNLKRIPLVSIRSNYFALTI